MGGVAPTDCIWRIGVGLGTVVGAGPSARREEDVLLFFAATVTTWDTVVDPCCMLV